MVTESAQSQITYFVYQASGGADPLLGSIPDEEPAPEPETPEEKAKWDEELKKGCKTFSLPSWYVLDDRVSSELKLCCSLRLKSKQLFVRPGRSSTRS